MERGKESMKGTVRAREKNRMMNVWLRKRGQEQ